MKKARLILLISAFCLVAGYIMSSKAEGNSKAAMTFSKDIAPIFYKNCVGCHRPGEIAPMSLISYKEVRPWAKSIREKVTTREMPPWHLDSHYGKWENDRRMTQKEIDAIVAWIDGGAQEGNPKDLPPPPKLASGWQIGEPDVVFQMQPSSPYRLKARCLISIFRSRQTSKKTVTSRLSKRERVISRLYTTS